MIPADPSASTSSSATSLDLYPKPTVSAFISAAITDGPQDEIAILGTRGDGKTTGVFMSMIAHAKEHATRGGALPTKWLGAADTFESHKRKTHESLQEALWRGTWRLEDDGHYGIFRDPGSGRDLVKLHLFGVEDVSGMERLRAQAHGLWFEEPAPVADLNSRGLTENAWGIGVTSCRMPSYRNPKLISENYPDDEHWTWVRFVVNRHPGTMYFRVPPGELASAEARAKWAESIKDPIMRRRLIEGRPGTIVPGRPVARGFNEDVHVAKQRLRPVANMPIYMGQDGGLMPATILAQRVGGRVHVLAALSSEHAGIRQHFQYVVLPWMGEHTPWALDDPHEYVKGWYDPSLDTGAQGDIEVNALLVLRKMLPGVWNAGPVDWPGRRDPLEAVLDSMDMGVPLLQLDPEFCRPLAKAYNGMWHYAITLQGQLRKEEPKKPNPPWADLGDASCYLLAGMAPKRAQRPEGWKPEASRGLGFDPRTYQRKPKARGVGFSPLRLR